MHGMVLASRRSRQKGVTAIEFAILFPVFFMILYGIVMYGMMFVAQQSLTLAAEEGARAALVYQPGNTTAAAALQARALVAQATCKNALSAVTAISSGKAKCPVPSSNPCPSPNAAMYCMTVTATYQNYNVNAPVPAIWPITSSMLPASLTNVATVQLDPTNII